MRLGGIYALERLARESRDDHGPIVEILTAYVREHAPWPPGADKPSSDVDQPAAASTPSDAPSDNEATAVTKSPTTDVQAVLTVLGRRRHEYDTDIPVDLQRTALAGANLGTAHLKGARLVGANLDDADLRVAHLEGADLGLAHLKRARLRLAHLDRSF